MSRFNIPTDMCQLCLCNSCQYKGVECNICDECINIKCYHSLCFRFPTLASGELPTTPPVVPVPPEGPSEEPV